jgi:hypothetical protein
MPVPKTFVALPGDVPNRRGSLFLSRRHPCRESAGRRTIPVLQRRNGRGHGWTVLETLYRLSAANIQTPAGQPGSTPAGIDRACSYRAPSICRMSDCVIAHNTLAASDGLSMKRRSAPSQLLGGAVMAATHGYVLAPATQSATTPVYTHCQRIVLGASPRRSTWSNRSDPTRRRAKLTRSAGQPDNPTIQLNGRHSKPPATADCQR